jgi:hypothetical protein
MARSITMLSLSVPVFLLLAGCRHASSGMPVPINATPDSDWDSNSLCVSTQFTCHPARKPVFAATNPRTIACFGAS